ncbi:hypothetical protein EWI61_05080 [Methylolobus aquaticus]|uniref:hypothetical protein n=1 Tax=Methylotetracoccus oryzae TaxID=1919059 RepID=UPI0010216FB6|nr:hypothetical protein [Methylotetracoccus oryzae]RYU61370.1 hypothetical protein EWI61_05080 [Methylolobus aquaticus]
MEQFNHALTTVFGIALLGALGFEISRRRRKLRDLYNVLDAEDKHVVAELDDLVASGRLQPYVAN